MAQVDKTIKKTFATQLVGSTMMLASGIVPMNGHARIATFVSGASVWAGGTIAGYHRLKEIQREKEEQEIQDIIDHYWDSLLNRW